MTPPRIAGRLAGLAAAGGARAAFVTLAVMVAARTDVLPFAVAAAVALAVVLFDASTVARRLDPLARHVARRRVDSTTAPPSDAAVRDATHAPRHLAVVAFAAWSVAALVGAAAALVAGRGDAAVAVLLLGVVASTVAALALAVGARRAIDVRLLAAVPAAEISPPAAARFARDDAATSAAIAAACVLAAAALLALRGHGALALALGVPLAFVAGSAGARLGLGPGRREAVAVASLVGRANGLGDAVASDAPRLAAAPPALDALARALDALEREAAAMRADEAAAARTDAAAQQMKTQFLAAMSHDLRSPLNSILGFSELLASGADGKLTPAQLESVQAIRASGGELLRLLTDIVDSARLEAGKLVVVRAWTPSVEILTEAVAQGRELIGERDLRIEVELQPGLPPVFVDRQRIVQAVVGLLGHAAQTSERGVIRLAARVAHGPPGPARQVRVTVHDESRAPGAAQRERIFEAFRAISEPGGRRIGGLGLNLSLARALVQMHGGEIGVDGALGGGTTFTVALPLDEAAAAGTGRGSLLR